MKLSIPSTMQAIQLDEPNGKLTLREIPVRLPQAGQVLVRMAAAPIDPADLGSVSGLSYGNDRRFPFTPGLEGSGTVVAVGEGLMPRLYNGRRVACSAMLSGEGTWAEYMVTTAQLCIPLNKGVSLEQGATLLVNPISALSILEIIRNKKHRAVVSTAAASSLGKMILHLGKRHNIPIIHIVRRQAQGDEIRELGGEYILNSNNADFNDQLQAMAKELHATLFLDAIGGNMTQQLAEAAPYGSTILLYAQLSGRDSIINSRTVLLKNLHLDGWFLANWVRTKNLLQILRLTQRAQSLLSTDLKSPIHKRIALADAQTGLEMYTSNMSSGKILLVANPEDVNVDG